MLQNYFYLNRFIIEANGLITGSRVVDIFSQEKSKLIMALSKDDEDFYLEICVIPGNSFINIREKYPKAKKNVLVFFNGAMKKEILSVSIASDDRILKFDLGDFQIYFAIRGKFTNVFCFNNNAEAFKSADEDLLKEFREEFKNKTYIRDYNIPELQAETSEHYLEIIKSKFPAIGNDILKEVKARAIQAEKNELELKLREVLADVIKRKPAVFIEANTGGIKIGFETFISLPYTEKVAFSNLIEAQNYYFAKKYFFESKNEKLKLIRSFLEKNLNKTKNKITSLQNRIERGIKADEYNEFGKLLLANFNLLKSGMKEITIQDFSHISGEAPGSTGKIKIKLDPKLSPHKNIESYFERARTEKTSFNKSKELLKIAEADYEMLKTTEEKLINVESNSELDEIMKELKIKQQEGEKASDDLKSRFKHYIIDSKYHLYVGKDSRNNDLLTTKFAKQNDYWFHARSVSGSHVVLRVENTKEAIPKNILKKAASIAAYHSKAKTAGVVPVAYTFKKYVVKKKGDPVGTVHLLREDVVMVKPKIPPGCEYVQSK